MKNGTLRLTSVLVLFSVVTAPMARAEGGIPALYDPSLIAPRMDRFIEDFKKWKAQEEGEGQQQAAASFLEGLAASLKPAYSREDQVDSKHPRLGSDLAASSAGGTLVGRRMLALKKRLGLSTARQSPESYQELIAPLIPRYYEQPADREAIRDLLGQVSVELADQPQPSHGDPVLSGIGEGVMYAWMAIVVLDWHRGLTEVSSNPRGLARMLAWIKRAVQSRGAAPKVAARASTAAIELAAGTGSALGPNGAPLKTLPQKVAGTLKEHGKQLLRAKWGALAGALYGLNEQTERMKVDPLELLKPIDQMLLLDLEASAIDLNRKFGESLREVIRVDGSVDVARFREKDKELATLVEEYKSLKTQIAFLQKVAPELQGQVPWPSLAVEAEDLRSRTWVGKARAGIEHQQALFVAESQKVSGLISRLNRRASEEAKKLGLKDTSELAVSFAMVDLNLNAIELALASVLEAAQATAAAEGNELP